MVRPLLEDWLRHGLGTTRLRLVSSQGGSPSGERLLTMHAEATALAPTVWMRDETRTVIRSFGANPEPALQEGPTDCGLSTLGVYIRVACYAESAETVCFARLEVACFVPGRQRLTSGIRDEVHDRSWYVGCQWTSAMR